MLDGIDHQGHEAFSRVYGKEAFLCGDAFRRDEGDGASHRDVGQDVSHHGGDGDVFHEGVHGEDV